MKIVNLIKDYLSSIELENKSSLTIRNYSHYLLRFADFLEGHFPISFIGDLNKEIINAYKAYLEKFVDSKGNLLDSRTQAYHLIALRSFIKFVRLNNIVTINPETIEIPKSHSRPLKFLDNQQIEILLRLADNLRDKCILELILATGLRVSDLVKINRQDVNFRNGEINFSTSGGFRTIFLMENALYWLSKYLKERQDNSPALFIRTAGRKDGTLRLTVRTIQRIVEKYVKEANLPIKATPHTLRHTFAINLLSEGKKLSAVQRILNHKNISTTQIYTHVTNPQLREIHKKFHARDETH